MESKQPIGLLSCIHERTAVTLHILVRMCLVFLDLDKIEVFIHSNVGKITSNVRQQNAVKFSRGYF